MTLTYAWNNCGLDNELEIILFEIQDNENEELQGVNHRAFNDDEQYSH